MKDKFEDVNSVFHDMGAEKAIGKAGVATLAQPDELSVIRVMGMDFSHAAGQLIIIRTDRAIINQD